MALNWLMNITTTAEITNWLIVGFISFRFRGALKAQGDTHWREQYSWKSFSWPAAPIWLLVTGSLYLAGYLFLGVTGDHARISVNRLFPEFMNTKVTLTHCPRLRIRQQRDQRTSSSI